VTRRFYLLRHAKSAWDDPTWRDDERPLAPKGEKAARRMRDHLHGTGFEVSLVLCSPARRALDTWAIVRDGVSGHPLVRFEPEIYEATVADLHGIIADLPDDVRGVLLIGHNPGFEELVSRLDASALPDGLPPGGFVTIEVRGSWHDVDRGHACVVDVTRPKELS
jgi:phosphohistidine phosphatase